MKIPSLSNQELSKLQLSFNLCFDINFYRHKYLLLLILLLIYESRYYLHNSALKFLPIKNVNAAAKVF